MLSRTIPESVANLEKIGISRADAFQLRRISMTLHRWHELECGDSDDFKSWCLVRGKCTVHREKNAQGLNCKRYVFEHDDEAGAPYIETHPHVGPVFYTKIADREAGAKRRLARILKSYPHLSAYVQTDPAAAPSISCGRATCRRARTRALTTIAAWRCTNEQIPWLAHHDRRTTPQRQTRSDLCAGV